MLRAAQIVYKLQVHRYNGGDLREAALLRDLDPDNRAQPALEVLLLRRVAGDLERAEENAVVAILDPCLIGKRAVKDEAVVSVLLLGLRKSIDQSGSIALRRDF